MEIERNPYLGVFNFSLKFTTAMSLCPRTYVFRTFSPLLRRKTADGPLNFKQAHCDMNTKASTRWKHPITPLDARVYSTQI